MATYDSDDISSSQTSDESLIGPPVQASARPHPLDLSRDHLAKILTEWGQRPFRTRQLLGWLCKRGATSFDAMSDVPLPVRERLKAAFSMAIPAIDKIERDSNGTRKYRFVAVDGAAFEAVYIPEVAKGRGTNTLCISSQTGCSVGCKFCFTASLKRHRNLAVSEILGQVSAAQNDVSSLGDGAKITNIVFMGMGEPLLNYDHVVSATQLLIDPLGFDFAPRRVTISTSGIVPRIETLGHAVTTQLAISLNATTDQQRTAIMPINKKWPLARLFAALRAYPLPPRRRFTIEYVMLGGLNDTPEDARRLVKLLDGLPNKVNLLPLNPHDRTPFTPPSDAAVKSFQQILLRAGLNVFIRTARGQEISAACGQLGESVPPLSQKKAVHPRLKMA